MRALVFASLLLLACGESARPPISPPRDGGVDGGESADAGANPCGGGGLLCGETCIDPRSDGEHCGTCDNACGAGATCESGECKCGIGLSVCEDGCFDVRNDAQHCGSCDGTCAPGVPCIQGQCGCPNGQIPCDGKCVDPSTDKNHCGGCYKPCDFACAGGYCCSTQLGAFCDDMHPCCGKAEGWNLGCAAQTTQRCVKDPN